MNRRVLVVVEGQTEFSVLNSTVAPHLGASGVFLHPKIVGRPGHKGGVYRTFKSVSEEIVTLFKQEPTAVVSTFFDFYAMPEDWPGVTEAKQAKTNGLMIGAVAGIVEKAWFEAIAGRTVELGKPAIFIPYIQMHEIEALLFAGPKHMAETFLQPHLERRFQDIVTECGSCEEINDRPTLAPSKRIHDLFPGYRKGRDKNKSEDRRPHAPLITTRIGLSTIREACPHFGQWISALESIGKPPQPN